MQGNRLIKRDDYMEMPWRNGGGVTFEIARAPVEGQKFDWRLSLAMIERSGPFSDFAGYLRAIALVSGAGCVLSGIEAQPLVLDAPGQFTVFPGAAQVTSDLVDGPCCDLNLMVREPGRILRVKHVYATQGEGEPLEANHHNAVFCLSGELACVNTADGQRIALSLHDTLIVNPAHARGWRVRTGNPAAMALTLAWEAPLA
jgi:environmental stress-induced protein Ves